jgi:succinyl-diaminopimelate desuccinylase
LAQLFFHEMTDPIFLAQALIRRPSVTPHDEGALSVLEEALKPLGFACHRLRFEAKGTPPVENLYARLGGAGPNFCFAGHTDVVPPGERSRWQHDPFAADIADGMLYGRGATDMKGAIAAFVAAVSRIVPVRRNLPGSVSLLITGDEEGPGINGTIKVLTWLKERGENLDHCLVGEPSSTARVGDTIKIGRRGSMNFEARIIGSQGHVAYPQLALNPIPLMAELVNRLSTQPLDKGSDHFDASTLSFTSVDVGNATTNVIPGEARAAFNIRFNDLHTPDSLLRHVNSVAKEVTRERGGEIAVTHEVSGVSFVTAPGRFTDILSAAVKAATGIVPEFATGGGTSDARFIKDHCPVAELGLPSRTMHKFDECVALADLEALATIYQTVLTSYFASPP